MTTTGPEAAAAARIGARPGGRVRGELPGLPRPRFARVEPWLQAGKYIAALTNDLPKRNGQPLAERAGDRTPDRMQRLLNRAVRDAFAAMAVVRGFAVAGLDEAARKTGRRRGLAVGALDETGQVKQGTRTAGVKRQGQLAIDILAGAFAGGVRLDFVCGDEVYGSCTELRAFLEARGQAYVLRVPSRFRLALPGGVRLTCQQAAAVRLAGGRRREVRSAGKGSKGQRWYAWARLGTASPRRHLLARRHLATGKLAFHYCYLPPGQQASLNLLARAAGLRWPAEENFQFSKTCLGPDQSQVRRHTALARHTVLVMAALAICAVTTAPLRRRTDAQAAAPARPGQAPPSNPGMIPLTVPETMRLLARPPPYGSTGHWLDRRRGHQARSRWYHQRTRLARHTQIALVT